MTKKTIKTRNKKSSKSSDPKCLHCYKKFATAFILSEHIKACHKPIECSVCGIITYGKSKARKHKLMKHMEPGFECAKCLRKFRFRFSYKRHSNACEADDIGLFSSEKNQDRGRSFYGIKSFSGTECISGLNLKDSSDAESKKDDPSSGEAECHHCGIKEINPDTLVRHILTHHEPVACDICGITWPSLCQAQDHKKKVHNESKNKCPYCSMQSWRGKKFQQHVLKCKSLKFPCKFCGKMFGSMCEVYLHKSNCPAKTVLNDRINVSKEREQKNAETSNSTENSHGSQEKHDATVMEKRTSPQSGSSETKCYYCDADFLSPGYLINHLKSYHELTKCDICGISILAIHSPNNHKIKCHYKPKFVCPSCGKRFYQKAKYDSHWSACRRKKYSCKICGHRYSVLKSLKLHKIREHPGIIIVEENSISSTNTDGAALEENVDDHEKVRSSRQGSAQERNSNNTEEIESLEDSQPSEKSLTSRNDDIDTDGHMVDKETRKLSVANLNGSCTNQVEAEIISQPLQQYRCSICVIAFVEFSDIREHMLTSHTDGMFECHICSKKFRNLKAMKIHADACADRKVSCAFCSKKFKNVSSAEIHKKRFHQSNEPLCNAVVEGKDCIEEKKSNIVEEMDFEQSSGEHQGVNPSSESCNAKCPHCVKKFDNESLLSRHIGRYHEPCACEVCGLTFHNVVRASFHKLRAHLNHTKFECPYCQMKYIRAERYERHMSICKSKKFSCDVCSNKFAALRYLVMHKKTYHPDAGNIDLKSKIQVEDTMLQEQDHQGPGEDQGISCTSTATNTDQQYQHEIDKAKCRPEPEFVCPTCGKNFYHKSQYNGHWPACQRRKYSCEICGRRFTELKSVKWHKIGNHPNIITMEKNTTSSQDGPNPSTKTDGAALEENVGYHEKVRSSRQSSIQERNSNNTEQIESLEDSQPSEKSLASMNDGIDTDGHMVDKETRKLSDAALNGSCKIQVEAERISQPLQQYSCSICKIAFAEFSHIREHMLTSHTDGKFECHICSKKFGNLKEMEGHADACADRKFSCSFCSIKFKSLSSAESHKKRYHHSNEPLSNAIVENKNCIEEKKSHIAEEIDFEQSSGEHQGVNPSSGSCNAKCPHCAKKFDNEGLLSRHIEQSHEPCACDICGLTFTSIGKANFHKIKTHLTQRKFKCLYCPMKYIHPERYEQHLSLCKSKEFSCDACGHKFAALRYLVKHKKISHLDGKMSVKARYCRKTNSQIQNQKQNEKKCVQRAGNIDLELEIKVEDTMLQEQDHQVLYEDQRISCTSTAARTDQQYQDEISKHPFDSKPEDVEAEDVAPANGIKIKAECQEEEHEENFFGAQSATESSECHRISSDQNESLHDADE